MNFNTSSDADVSKTKKNVPIPTKEIVHNDDLVHGAATRKYVRKRQIQELSENMYQCNGLGITYRDIMIHFRVSKRKAQRTLKHFRMKKFLFTAEDIEKQDIHLNGIKRENPQRYYLTEMKTKIIRNRKNYVQLGTTEISTQNQHKVTHFQELLAQLSLVLLYVHKLQLKTTIARENYDLLNLPKIGIAKIHCERIGQAHGPHNVEYHIHTNGTVMIYISCTDKPFRLVGEQDILKIMMFLSRVEDRLKVLLGDRRDDVVPPVIEWILKACDINKDIVIDNMAQLTLPDIQISLAEKAFRGYVKLIGEKAYYRMEQASTPNEPVPTALEELRTDAKLDKDSLSL